MNHLDEVAGARRAAVKIALFGGAGDFFPARRAWDIADAGSEGFEDGIQMLDRVFGAADHHAIATLDAPDAAAGANVDVVDLAIFQLQRTANVIFVIGVAAVNDDVARFEALGKSIDSLLGGIAGGNHDPGGARLFEFGGKVIE